MAVPVGPGAALGRLGAQRETTTEADLRLMTHGHTVKPVFSDTRLNRLAQRAPVDDVLRHWLVLFVPLRKPGVMLGCRLRGSVR